MIERIFTDIHGKELIVKHRKSAVFFERIGNLNEVDMYEPYLQWGNGKETIRGEAIPHYRRTQTDLDYYFDNDTLMGLLTYLEEISQHAWKNFIPKVADSLRADYDSYWDRDFDDEGNLTVYNSKFKFSPPYQPTNKKVIIRLYKFDRRKFESFIYDLREILKIK